MIEIAKNMRVKTIRYGLLNEKEIDRYLQQHKNILTSSGHKIMRLRF